MDCEAEGGACSMTGEAINQAEYAGNLINIIKIVLPVPLEFGTKPTQMEKGPRFTSFSDRRKGVSYLSLLNRSHVCLEGLVPFRDMSWSPIVLSSS
ncbi:hypothetical protein NDU88_009088 [Pleurodeles waltl]|uniref:Uncharacterized protein n=1 Tax=Pleurodeles waltl TaxID=8319 RepID=A0AAV7NZV7_PLEWA|nr:hypothetical protein NDU88_009088 [Pleurodeles waltl]